jgi:hypothetical protein
MKAPLTLNPMKQRVHERNSNKEIIMKLLLLFAITQFALTSASFAAETQTSPNSSKKGEFSIIVIDIAGN